MTDTATAAGIRAASVAGTPVGRACRFVIACTLAAVLIAGPAWAADAGAPPPDGEEAVSPSDIPDPLSLDQAVELFRTHGFDLLLADAAVVGARGDLVSASAFPNPLASGAAGTAFNYDPDRCGSSGCSATAVNVSLSDQGLLVDLAVGKRRLRIQGAAAALEAAQYSRTDAERILVPTVRAQYTQAVLAAAMLDAAQKVARTASDTSDLVHQRFDSGAASEADLARAEVAKLEADRAVDSASEELATAKVTLAVLLGAREGAATYQLAEPLRPFVVPGPLREASLAALREQALAHRADLAAARAQVQSAQAALELAQRQRFPDVSVLAQYQQQGTGQNAIQPETATFGLSLPLPVLYQNQGEIIGAEADLRTRKITEQKVVTQVAGEVATAFAAFQSARDRVQLMQAHLLERAQRARDLVEYRYTKGATSLFEYLEAQRTFVMTQTEYYQDLGDYWAALYKLDQAAGVEFET